MGQRSQTSIAVNNAQKEAVVDLQDYLEDELGTRPTQGEAVSIAAEHMMEGDA